MRHRPRGETTRLLANSTGDLWSNTIKRRHALDGGSRLKTGVVELRLSRIEMNER